MVPRAGIEPAWPCDRRILSPLRLPIPPPGRPVYPLEWSPSLDKEAACEAESRALYRLLPRAPAHYGALTPRATAHWSASSGGCEAVCRQANPSIPARESYTIGSPV